MAGQDPITEGYVHDVGNTLNLEDLGEEKSSVKIHLNTLSRIVSFEPGSYGMYVLKNIKATEGFLGMTEIERGCQVEPFETCEVRNYFEKVRSQCDCTPWSLTRNISEEVIIS